MLLFPIHLTKIKTVFLRWKPGVTPSLQAVYFKKNTSLDNSKNVNDDYVKQWNFAKREALLEAPRKGFQAQVYNFKEGVWSVVCLPCVVDMPHGHKANMSQGSTTLNSNKKVSKGMWLVS